MPEDISEDDVKVDDDADAQENPGESYKDRTGDTCLTDIQREQCSSNSDEPITRSPNLSSRLQQAKTAPLSFRKTIYLIERLQTPRPTQTRQFRILTLQISACAVLPSFVCVSFVSSLSYMGMLYVYGQ